MIETHLKEVATELESFLVAEFRPYFLSIVTLPDMSPPQIQVLISAHRFKGMSIKDRLSYIYDLLKVKKPDIIVNNAIIIEAYTASELEDLIEYTDL